MNQDNILTKLQNMIPKKKSMMNNNCTLNNKIISHTSRKLISNSNPNINNYLFENENLAILHSDYDDKFDNLYSVINKINFDDIPREIENIFSNNSEKYKEYKTKFDFEFFKKYGNTNIEKNKMKFTKKTINYSSSRTDFSSSNKNWLKNLNNNSIIVNDFEIVD